MKTMICELCESKKFVKHDGVYECQSCGTMYSPEEARKLITEIPDVTTGSKPIYTLMDIPPDIGVLHKHTDSANRQKSLAGEENAAPESVKKKPKFIDKFPNLREYVENRKGKLCLKTARCVVGLGMYILFLWNVILPVLMINSEMIGWSLTGDAQYYFRYIPVGIQDLLTGSWIGLSAADPVLHYYTDFSLDRIWQYYYYMDSNYVIKYALIFGIAVYVAIKWGKKVVKDIIQLVKMIRK